MRIPLLMVCVYLSFPSQSRAETLDRSRLAKVDTVVEEALKRGDCPGAVLVVVHRDSVVFRKAYGYARVQPEKSPMTVEHIFDLASLTKSVATTGAIFKLIEDGKLKLSDRAVQHWPAFKGNQKENITIEHLLLHTSGLTADNALADYRDGKGRALERIAALTLEAEPGKRFRYSDVGFIVLGEIVERLSGESLDAFTRKHLFQPLGMSTTGFRPAENLLPRIAPTGQREGKWLVGEVHDPRAAAMGGVAGHAGLFACADDLVRYVRMLLREGELDGKRIFSPLTVRLMTEPRVVSAGWRTLGWDVDTSFSGQSGELFRRREGFGHTGFTGTSIWVDRFTQTAIILLTNRVHPNEKGNVSRLRRDIGTLVAAAVTQVPPQRPSEALPMVRTGIDVLARDRFRLLKDRRVALVTNHTGKDRTGKATIDLLHEAEGVQLVALFSPEHGIRGELDQANIGDTRDNKTGLPVYSLYGKRRKPDADTLKGVDTVVYDIQDIGCRFYTYISTMGLVLEAAAEHKLKVIILDRPNPIGGIDVQGPLLDAGRESFVAYHSLPVRHGMTVGELAKMFVAERKLNVDLEVVRVEGWQRRDMFDRTGLTWTNPSPNMRSLTAAYLYPGIGLLETTNVSVGRGTDRPFEWIGAPWMDGAKLAEALARENLTGVRFVPMVLTPISSVHQGKSCSGIHIIIDDWQRFQPLRTGLTIAVTLRKLYPDDWNPKGYERLLLHKATFEGVQAAKPVKELEAAWATGLQAFRERRKSFLLYPE